MQADEFLPPYFLRISPPHHTASLLCLPAMTDTDASHRQSAHESICLHCTSPATDTTRKIHSQSIAIFLCALRPNMDLFVSNQFFLGRLFNLGFWLLLVPCLAPIIVPSPPSFQNLLLPYSLPEAVPTLFTILSC